jgi:hypothetical protein
MLHTPILCMEENEAENEKEKRPAINIDGKKVLLR